MAHVYMIRGQGLGVLHEKVYASFPPVSVLEEALAKELVFHGVRKGKPIERWVCVFVVEVVGVDSLRGYSVEDDPIDLDAEPPPDAVWRLSGTLTPEEVEAMIVAGPPVSYSPFGEVVATGAGLVVNPK